MDTRVKWKIDEPVKQIQSQIQDLLMFAIMDIAQKYPDSVRCDISITITEQQEAPNA